MQRGNAWVRSKQGMRVTGARRRANTAGMTRRFLFLQGPHGPFFSGLARRLMAAGADVERIGFTLGDRVFWRGLTGFHKFDGQPDTWEAFLKSRIEATGITDIVCYGGT